MKRILLVSALMIFVPFLTGAQTGLDYYLPDGVTYNKAIPVPSSYLGYEVGEWHVTHDKLLGYMKLLGSVSDRAIWEEYGKSWEERPLGHLIITSAKNMERLDEIRLEHLKLSDPAVSQSLNTEDMPLVIELGYGVHGDESSGPNASVLTAYYLVAAEGPEIDRILDNTVILIDPSRNPDGLQRNSTWENMYRGMNPTTDPASREFREAWPGGRTNHYWSNLNRDYIMLQHPESVGRVEAFFRWMPDIDTDHHEMGANSTFFFQPGIQSRNNPLVPADNGEMTARIADYHAKYLDSIGSLYYSEESFDDFYPGKGSAYPDLHGSVGILFEQAGLRGIRREVPDGIATFAFSIRNQFTVSMSTIKAGLDLRVQLLNMQRDFYLTALREADSSPVKGYVFTTSDDLNAGAYFIENLMRHNIEVYRCARKVTRNGVTYGGPDSYFVPIKQREYRFIRSLFEPVFNFKDTIFYDISTWVLPMSFNISYAELNKAEVTGMQGTRVDAPPFPAGSVEVTGQPYAWLFEWNDFNAPRALYKIQEAGLTARVATSRFTMTVDGKSRNYDYGTILIHSRENSVPPEKMKDIMTTVAEECGITIYGVPTGLTSSGIDLGSNQFVPIEKPSVLLIIDEGISYEDAGEIWHLLDARYGMQVTMMSASQLASARLARYNVIIMAGDPHISGTAVERLRDWNRQGGTIIAYKDGNKWVAENKFAEINYIEKASLPEGLERKYSDRNSDRAIHAIPGSIFQVRLDLTHPLCFGYTRPLLPVFKSETTAVKETGTPYNNPVRFTSSPLLSGYCTNENIERIKNSLLVEVHNESGRVISIYDNTNFRAIWFGTEKIFANAVFFGQILRQEYRY